MVSPHSASASRAPYAANPALSRGRLHDEPPPLGRSPFQRDRDRIVHSTAFRRLEYKTQVFINHEGDLFRTRLTHSLEVAQIARSVARRLRLDEDLTEAIALAHDLGHTPFGHAGQDALNACLNERAPQTGGFEHNLQSLRVVDVLEQRYPAFDGLNLSFETREGILKHCAPRHAKRLGELGVRFLTGGQPSLEAQLANLADEVAYNNHDVDDGLRSGLLTLAQLDDAPLWGPVFAAVRRDWPDAPQRRQIYETVRRMINLLVDDITAASLQRLHELKPQSIDDVRQAGPLICFSDPMRQASRDLKRFLFANLYRHPAVMAEMNRAKQIVKALFDGFCDQPALLPQQDHDRAGRELHRTVADYIAGMTDRYALKEHRRITTVC